MQNKFRDNITTGICLSSDVMEIVKAVAHIGVDFGYGEYVIEDKHIEAARKIMTALEKGQ
jgi:hypothetical protein